ncbi:glycosyltransferase family 2 protein [Apibacter sp. HY039]|uniref:glycosyltransferase family 2 protein n=1 Tax=Apibacter sp. HY039 TaxID=2501476 RepID=UPI000FEB7285|nr:glycosyltransferase family 2 protein [Apibacter sp. HY039]
MIQLSVIIVNYNSKFYLKSCLESVNDASRNLNVEIIVIDNDSSDGSYEFIISDFPQITWIQNSENLGFSKANNIAFQKSSGKYILFVNPDVIVSQTALEELYVFSENQQNLGAIGVRMTDEHGNYRLESKRNIPNPSNTFSKLFSYLKFFSKNIQSKGYYNVSISEYEIGKIEILTGAFFWVSGKVYEEAGGFDESYFMYGEDIDLSYTILRLGYQNYYYGKSTVVHYKGKSTVKNKQYYQRFFGAMKIFIKKYYSRPYYLYILLLTGLNVRYYLALTLDKLKKK